MPGRRALIAILLFWSASFAWLLWREIGPRRSEGEPPPVMIDLSDESGRHVIWAVRKDGERIGTTMSRVRFEPADETYHLISDFHQTTPNFGGEWKFPIKSMSSVYKVGQDGKLYGLYAAITLDVRGVEVKAQVIGKVEGARLIPEWEFIVGTQTRKMTGYPVDVSTGSLLNPMQLFNRLDNIDPGQQWRIQRFDPLADSLAGLVAGAGGTPELPYVDATVSEAPDNLQWNGQEESCLVIEYRGEDNFLARTWVRKKDGLILRQEAALAGSILVQERTRD